ncbi:MAG: bifunctional 3-deoxy-7-phosphoheptulonate synthase/chorismate mutase type II [Sedimentisphaerales bacterium]|nr:bifunctional 3-deoxy-7-phosphoheptulonate synthase/chorismate mutase type II [Sedimentisphaerales bacterium]
MPDGLKELNKQIQDIPALLGIKKIPWLIAGPCSAETEEQVMATAVGLAKCPNVKVFRAGIWKPRTRPNCFEGVGEEGLKWLRKVKEQTGLLTATEVANPKHVELCLENKIDILWVGARTTVSPFIVQEIADSLRGVDIPVLVKNPVNTDIGLWIGAFERLYQSGVKKLGAIHRGFSSFEETEYRNKPHWEIPIELKRLMPNIPIICDPSHIGGDRKFIEPISQMALDLGINGLMIETHIEPAKALSDSKQQITPKELIELLGILKVRDTVPTDVLLKAQITRLRTSISRIDSRIIQDIADRMKFVEEIGQLKQKNKIPVLQMDRWESLLKDHIEKGLDKGLDKEFTKALFELIHTQAVKKQF